LENDEILNHKSAGFSMGQIIGLSTGLALVVIGILGFICYWKTKKKGAYKKTDTQEMMKLKT